MSGLAYAVTSFDRAELTDKIVAMHLAEASKVLHSWCKLVGKTGKHAGLMKMYRKCHSITFVNVMTGRDGVFKAHLADKAAKIRGKDQSPEAIVKLRQQRILDLKDAGLVEHSYGAIRATLPNLEPIYQTPKFRRCLLPQTARYLASKPTNGEAQTHKVPALEVHSGKADTVGSKSSCRGRDKLGRFTKVQAHEAQVVDLKLYRDQKKDAINAARLPANQGCDTAPPLSARPAEVLTVGQLRRQLSPAETKSVAQFRQQMPRRLADEATTTKGYDMDDVLKMPKHITKDTAWPQPHTELMRLASNLEDRVYEEVYPVVALLKSAHKYRHELAELERRDNPDAINEHTKSHEGAWNKEIEVHESDKYRDPEDPAFDPNEMIENLTEVLDGCAVLVRAAQGKSLGTEIKPWMFDGTTREQQKRVALREGQREIERAFISCISNMAAYIAQYGLEMAIDPDSKDPDEQEDLRKHNGMTLSEHLSQLCHRLEKFSTFQAQYDRGFAFGDEFEEAESYDDWLHQFLLGEIKGKSLRSSVAAVVREQRKACEVWRKEVDEMHAKQDAKEGLGNVVKLHG